MSENDNGRGAPPGEPPLPPAPAPVLGRPSGRENKYEMLARAYLAAGRPFHDAYREAIAASLVVPPRRTVLTQTLIAAAIEEMAAGAWPRDLPDMLNVPKNEWAKWIKKGEQDTASDEESLEADLYAVIARVGAVTEREFRRGLVNLAMTGAPTWGAFGWLLARFRPDRYNEQVDARVEMKLTEIMRALRDSAEVSAEDFEKFVRALEQAKRDGLGARRPAVLPSARGGAEGKP